MSSVWSIFLAVIGLLLEIGGVYYLSRGVFINEIRRTYRYGEREIKKFPFVLRLACWTLRINQQNIEEIILEGNSRNVPVWPQLTSELKKVILQPFYGFLLLFFGLLCQIVALFF